MWNTRIIFDQNVWSAFCNLCASCSLYTLFNNQILKNCKTQQTYMDENSQIEMWSMRNDIFPRCLVGNLQRLITKDPKERREPCSCLRSWALLRINSWATLAPSGRASPISFPALGGFVVRLLGAREME